MTYLEIGNVIMSIIFSPVKITMEVTVVLLTSLNGHGVLTIQNSLEMEYVLLISKPKLNVIMMVETAVIKP